MLCGAVIASCVLVFSADRVPEKVASVNVGRQGTESLRWQSTGDTLVGRSATGGLNAWKWSGESKKLSLTVDKMNDGHVVSSNGAYVAVRELDTKVVSVLTVSDYTVRARFESKYDPEVVSDDGEWVAFAAGVVFQVRRSKDGSNVWESRIDSPHLEFVQLIRKPRGALLINDRNLENPKAGSAKADLVSFDEAWRPKAPSRVRLFRPHAVALSGDGSTLVVSESNGDVVIWDTVKGMTISTPRKGLDIIDYAVRISRDAKWVAMGGDASRARRTGRELVHGEVSVSNVLTGKEMVNLRFPGNTVRAVDISPDNRWLAVGTESGEISLWDVGEFLK
jgi:WD40 repeat protein